MSTRRSISTTGEHTIDNIIRTEYGNDLSPEEHIEKKKHLATLNPHIVSLESLRVGDQVFLEDEPEEDLSILESGKFHNQSDSGESGELSGESGELSGESGELSGDQGHASIPFVFAEDQAVDDHVPHDQKKKKK